MNKITFAAAAALLLGSCTSYEIDMPENPAEPVVGEPVPTEVIYQANPRLFAQNQCLNALTAQLPRISDMGCNILWVMPIYEAGELNAIGSPYCVRDFKAVNPKYGTLADFKALVSDAHARGMKVMLDWVANHTAWDHPWITQHPDRYKKDVNGNIVSPSGWSDVAQLDFNNPETCEAMEDAMLYWVNECKIDGYRCDYADGVPLTFWTKLITDLHNINADIMMLAETGDTSFYQAGFDMIYDWNSATTIAKSFTGGKPTDIITEATSALANVPEGKSILRYVLNHDVAAENDVDRMFGSIDALPAAYVCASMLNGTPMIYSAMDVEGLRGKISFFNYNPLNFSTKLTEVYRKINNAFKQSEELRRGELRDYSNSYVVCFTRVIPGHTLMVAVNTTANQQTFKTPIELTATTMTDMIGGGTVTVPVTVDLEPYGYTILMN